jgi:selenocysteine-specific elongation factor
VESAERRFAILGTAGHIDHGKTALVHLLTGTDTDRLKEEKARGISIDLGFAHLDLPGGISCGVVDVPGHERFVKNMLAGACGVDAMLLVIAADEGVMPQTREHLDILDLLGVKRGVVALTKIDMVEEEWLELVTESVKEYLDARGFGDFPVVPVSSKTGEGRDAVLAALAGALAELEERPSARAVRLPVDRAFVVEGFGTVVTGTLWQGTIRPGDRLVVEPGGVETRVRNVEVHGEHMAEARAGQRTAVALAGIPRDAVPRGTWLLGPDTLHPASMIDVRLRVLRDAPKELRHRQRVRFHLGASEILGRVVLLEGERIRPGGEGLAQIRLEEPAVADRGDRFVLRSYSPARAIAGGTVILPDAPKRRRGHGRALEEIRLEESGSAEDRFLAALGEMPHGGSAAEVGRHAGLAPAEASEAEARVVKAGTAVRLPDGNLVTREQLESLSRKAGEVLQELQHTNPLRWGTSRGELKSRLGAKLPAALFDHLTAALVTDGRVSQRGDVLRWGGEDMVLSPELQARVDRVARELEAGGVTPPTAKELQTRLGFNVLEALEHLTFRGDAVKVTPELFLSLDSVDRIVGWLERFFQNHRELSMADLREALGMSRKYSVPVLEHLDRQGWTRRAGDVRVAGRRLEGVSRS